MFYFIIAVFLGILCGTAAFVLKWMIAELSYLLTSHFDAKNANWMLLVLPLMGIVLAGIFQRYVIHSKIEHGTERLKADLGQKDYWLRPKMLYAPMTASTITLAFGGSAGSEGPIAFTGAAIGSNIAKICGLPANMMMILVGCGAGAGIAGIFKSPVGGALFAIEVLGIELTNIALIALFITCIVSGLTAYLWDGCTPDVKFIPTDSFDPSILPMVIVLGLFCGLYGYFYWYSAQRTRARLDAIKNPWVKNIVAGGLLSILIFIFPSLFGEGYGIVGKLINETSPNFVADSYLASLPRHAWIVIVAALGILISKGIAATLTNSGGGVAGEFAPTLFAGAMAGYFFAFTCNLAFGLALPTTVFALTGMAATMAAIIGAPLMAIFLTAEMTWNYEFFLPLTVAAFIAFFTARFLKSLTSKA